MDDKSRKKRNKKLKKLELDQRYSQSAKLPINKYKKTKKNQNRKSKSAHEIERLEKLYKKNRALLTFHEKIMLSKAKTYPQLYINDNYSNKKYLDYTNIDKSSKKKNKNNKKKHFHKPANSDITAALRLSDSSQSSRNSRKKKKKKYNINRDRNNSNSSNSSIKSVKKAKKYITRSRSDENESDIEKQKNKLITPEIDRLRKLYKKNRNLLTFKEKIKVAESYEKEEKIKNENKIKKKEKTIRLVCHSRSAHQFSKPKNCKKNKKNESKNVDNSIVPKKDFLKPPLLTPKRKKKKKKLNKKKIIQKGFSSDESSDDNLSPKYNRTPPLNLLKKNINNNYNDNTWEWQTSKSKKNKQGSPTFSPKELDNIHKIIPKIYASNEYYIDSSDNDISDKEDSEEKYLRERFGKSGSKKKKLNKKKKNIKKKQLNKKENNTNNDNNDDNKNEEFPKINEIKLDDTNVMAFGEEKIKTNKVLSPISVLSVLSPINIQQSMTFTDYQNKGTVVTGISDIDTISTVISDTCTNINESFDSSELYDDDTDEDNDRNIDSENCENTKPHIQEAFKNTDIPDLPSERPKNENGQNMKKLRKKKNFKIIKFGKKKHKKSSYNSDSYLSTSESGETNAVTTDIFFDKNSHISNEPIQFEPGSSRHSRQRKISLNVSDCEIDARTRSFSLRDRSESLKKRAKSFNNLKKKPKFNNFKKLQSVYDSCIQYITKKK